MPAATPLDVKSIAAWVWLGGVVTILGIGLTVHARTLRRLRRQSFPVGPALETELAAAAETSLRAGQHVIVDAAFLNREDRQQFLELSKRADADFVIVDVYAEPDELLRRVQLRQRDANDPSEADAGVLRHQYQNADPLDTAELTRTIAVPTDANVDVDAVVAKIGAVRRS